MSDKSLESFLKARADGWLSAAGHSRTMADAAKREAGAWLRSRTVAARTRRRLYAGWGIVWTSAAHGTVELAPIEVPSPARGQVTIAVQASVVSPGTERAQYLRLPHAQPAMPFRPGYSAAGLVVAVGAGIENLRPGDAVAATGAQHASVVTLSASDVHRLPDGVGMEAAATVMLGVISGHGVEASRLAQGERVCVLGAGLIGLLAQRIAEVSGAGELTAVAVSRRREHAARLGGAAEFLTADDVRVSALAADVVIEASGSPAAINASIGAAAPGGRVVLLGSPRGRTTGFPLDRVIEKRLELIGAHVSTLGARRRGIAHRYLSWLASGSVVVDDLIGRRLDPREPELFYRELAADGDVLGATFDWTVLEDGVRRGTLMRIPDVSGRGADSTRRLAPPTRGRDRVALKQGDDPFAGAQGLLRFGMVGCGDIAAHNGGAIAKAPNAVLTAAYDLDRALAEDVAAGHDAYVARTYDDLLERPDVDAVFLSVPHHLHAPLAIRAVNAGKHIIVEKPPANDLRNAVEMVRAAENAGVTLSVCFPHRYASEVAAARRLIEQGAVGDITGVTAELFMDRSPSYRLGGFSSRSISDWRDSREKAGGGVLIMNLSHYVDLLHHLTGLEAHEISAFGSGRNGSSEVEDSISISMRMGNGAVGAVIGTTQARGSLFTQLRIWGSHGQIALEHEPRFYTLKSVDGLRTTRWQRFGRLPAVDIRAAFVSRFASAVADGRMPDLTAREALGVQAMMEAAYLSMDAGRPVIPADLLEGVAA
jgi:2-desacetyl-2-hydroxyethyl bacteriochlorophyllide A dehydrogenase